MTPSDKKMQEDLAAAGITCVEDMPPRTWVRYDNEERPLVMKMVDLRIFKGRSMAHVASQCHKSVTWVDNQMGRVRLRWNWPRPLTLYKNRLIEGDPMDPQSTDLILQEGRLPVGEPIPEGWTVTTGNNFDSQAFRIVYRYQIEEENFVKAT